MAWRPGRRLIDVVKEGVEMFGVTQEEAGDRVGWMQMTPEACSQKTKK